MVLVFLISNFFNNENSQGRKLSSKKKIPTCGNSALGPTPCRPSPLPVDAPTLVDMYVRTLCSTPSSQKGGIERMITRKTLFALFLPFFFTTQRQTELWSKVIYSKYCKKYAYALAQEMRFMCFGIFQKLQLF